MFKFIQKSAAILALVFLSANFGIAQNGADIEFEKESHNYGNIKYGADGKYVFVFENTGNAPLTISECVSSCGCTVPSWPRTPIAPGAKGEIEVVYDTKKPGAINKEITIKSNSKNNPSISLKIKGNVMPKPANG